MKYLEIRIEPECDEPPHWWCKLLSVILPPAEPGLRPFYSAVHTWWLEVDEESRPCREIGFDTAMKPVVLGPIGDNRGLLVDSPIDWSGWDEFSEEAARDFDQTWQELWPQFNHLAGKQC